MFLFCVLLFLFLFVFLLCVYFYIVFCFYVFVVFCFFFRQAITTASHQLPYRVIHVPQRVIQLPQRVMTRCGNYHSESSSVQRSLPAGASHTGGCFTPVCCDLARGPRVGAQRCLPHRRPFRTIFCDFLCAPRVGAQRCLPHRRWFCNVRYDLSCGPWLGGQRHVAHLRRRLRRVVGVCACNLQSRPPCVYVRVRVYVCVGTQACGRTDATSVGCCQKAIIKQFQERN